MNRIERELGRRLSQEQAALAAATPGLVLQAYRRGRKIADVRWGTTYEYYDLASLTKIIFTATVAARTFAAGRVGPDTRVVDLWPEFPHHRITLGSLMTHTAGLPWWRPFFKVLSGRREFSVRWPQLIRRVRRLKTALARRAIYSDPDLLVLAECLQRATGRELPQLWQDLAKAPEFDGLHFNQGQRRLRSKSAYAPTERCSWRRRVLQGEVHDENAYALGGLAPHAGLFGRADDVSRWALGWRKALHGSRSLVAPEWARRFTRRQIPAARGDWGWLFMKPTRGSASCGKYFSAEAFGHTGFTGSSVWYDPRRDLLVTILANRVHPTRDNRQFLAWRPRLHDWICEVAD